VYFCSFSQKIAYFFTPHKRKQIGWDNFVLHCQYVHRFLTLSFRSEGVTLVELTADTLRDVGPFDILFLRVTEAVAAGDEKSLELLQQFLSEHPTIKVKDPIAGQAATVRRDTMSHLVQKLAEIPGPAFLVLFWNLTSNKATN
jgi:hypothetical protein